MTKRTISHGKRLANLLDQLAEDVLRFSYDVLLGETADGDETSEQLADQCADILINSIAIYDAQKAVEMDECKATSFVNMSKATSFVNMSKVRVNKTREHRLSNTWRSIIDRSMFILMVVERR